MYADVLVISSTTSDHAGQIWAPRSEKLSYFAVCTLFICSSDQTNVPCWLHPFKSDNKNCDPKISKHKLSVVSFKLNCDSTASCTNVDILFMGLFRQFLSKLCELFHMSHWGNIERNGPISKSCGKGLLFIKPNGCYFPKLLLFFWSDQNCSSRSKNKKLSV